MSTTPPPKAQRLPIVALAEHVAAIRALGKQTVENVIEIGRRLSECKKLVGRGNWGCWLDREFAWSERSAQRFMQVFELAKSQSANLSDLDLPVSALYLLASAPETARGIIDKAQAGETISVAEVKQTIADTRTDTKGRQQPARRKPTTTTKPAEPKPSDAAVMALKPSHDRAARKLLDQFCQAPGEVQRHFLAVMRDDIGPDSSGEIERLRARVEELQAEKRRLEIENVGLRSEVEELKARLAAQPPPPANDDGLDIPASLRRSAS